MITAAVVICFLEGPGEAGREAGVQSTFASPQQQPSSHPPGLPSVVLKYTGDLIVQVDGPGHVLAEGHLNLAVEGHVVPSILHACTRVATHMGGRMHEGGHAEYKVGYGIVSSACMRPSPYGNACSRSMREAAPHLSMHEMHGLTAHKYARRSALDAPGSWVGQM